MPHEDDDDKPSVPDQLETLFPKDARGRYTIGTLTEIRQAFAIIDDAAATRNGLEKAYHDPKTKKSIEKQADKAGHGSNVNAYIDEKAAEAEEMSKAKADIIHSYIRNNIDEYAAPAED